MDNNQLFEYFDQLFEKQQEQTLEKQDDGNYATELLKIRQILDQFNNKKSILGQVSLRTNFNKISDYE